MRALSINYFDYYNQYFLISTVYEIDYSYGFTEQVVSHE